MARISMNWKATALPTASIPGYDGSEQDIGEYLKSFAGEKPAIVYFFDPRESKENDKVASTVFATESVGAAARAFDLLKIDVSKIAREDLRDEYSKSTPKFHFYSRSGDLIAKVQGKVTIPSFSSALSKAFGSEYETTLNGFLKQHRTILDRLDRAQGQKTRVAEKRTRLESSSRRDARTAALEREIVKEEEEAEAELQRVIEEERALLESLKLRALAKN